MEFVKAEKNKKMGAIIQARMTSHRLPGKVMKDIEGRPVLDHIIKRLERVVDRDAIVIATSQEASDDPIEVFARNNQINIFRGSLEDVLDRIYEAARYYSLDPIIRVTGDNPLIEIAYLSDLIHLFQKSNCDYATAKNPQYFPRGTTAEVTSFEALQRAWEEGDQPDDREHVTWYIRRNSKKFRISQLAPRDEWKSLPFRLALDEKDDFKLLQNLFSRLYCKNPLFGLDEMLNLYAVEPELFKINQNVKVKISTSELNC